MKPDLDQATVERTVEKTAQPYSVSERILDYLKDRGEQRDDEIAAGTGISLASVRASLSKLSAKNMVMSCSSIRFEQGKRIESVSCRLVGFLPSFGPGRRAK